MHLDAPSSIKKLTKHTVRVRLDVITRLVLNVVTKNPKNKERIHRLRTETRRAQAALRLFSDFLPRRRTELMAHQLREIRTLAGSVRDLDVLLPFLETLSEPLPTLAGESDESNILAHSESSANSHLPAELTEWLKQRASTLRLEAMKSLKHYCRRTYKGGIELRVQSLAQRTKKGQIPDELSGVDFRHRAINRLEAEFFDAERSLDYDHMQLHKVRRLGRRLRYTLDLLKESFPSSSFDAICKNLSNLQETLGAVNDRIFAQQFLKHRVSECQEPAIATTLAEFVDAFEASTAEQEDSAIGIIIDNSQALKNLLDELKLELSQSSV